MPEYMTKDEAAGFFQDVKDLFVQTERLLKESSLDTEKRFQDTERQLKESSRETERQLKESSRETERQLKESSRETDKQLQETGKIIKELSVKLGQLGGRLGEFVEEMVKPAAVRLFTTRGLNVRQVFRNVTRYDDQGQFLMEVDLLVVDTDTAVAIECKSHCSVEDVADHLDRLSRFKEYFPQYGAFHLYGAVAAMVMPDDVARFAYRKGLYVLAQSGDTILIRNDDRFKPREW